MSGENQLRFLHSGAVPTVWVAFDLNVARAKFAQSQLAAMDAEMRMRRREKLEAVWLKANRDAYVGKWIALDGDVLLAAGETAREVFASVAGRVPIPLVIKIRESTPFAGW